MQDSPISVVIAIFYSSCHLCILIYKVLATDYALLGSNITVLLFNSLTTNDAYMRHDPCELSISLWEFIWSIKY